MRRFGVLTVANDLLIRRGIEKDGCVGQLWAGAHRAVYSEGVILSRGTNRRQIAPQVPHRRPHPAKMPRSGGGLGVWRIPDKNEVGDLLTNI